MPHFIVKPDPNKDEYVDWSTIVDMPGPPHPRPEHMNDLDAARYDRADETGTSANWPGLSGAEQPYGWHRTEFSIGWPYGDDYPDEHDFIVKRSDLPELGRRCEANADYSDLIRYEPQEN